MKTHSRRGLFFLNITRGVWRTLALDNGVYFVSASITPPSMIIDSSGTIIAETHGDGLAYANKMSTLTKDSQIIGQSYVNSFCPIIFFLTDFLNSYVNNALFIFGSIETLIEEWSY